MNIFSLATNLLLRGRIAISCQIILLLLLGGGGVEIEQIYREIEIEKTHIRIKGLFKA